jgi:NADH:ubiquinone oxidoreductase subunit H
MHSILHFIYTHVPPWAVIAVVTHLVILGAVAYLILLERKIASWVQDRIGPNRVNLDFGILPFKMPKFLGGFGQPLADGVKFIVKEDYQPKGVDKTLFTIAPAVMVTVIIISIAVLPWGGTIRTTRDVDVTGTQTNSGRQAAYDNIVAGGELIDPVTKDPSGKVITEASQFRTYKDGDRLMAYVVYDETNAAGQVKRSQRVVDISGNENVSANDLANVIQTKLPADAKIARDVSTIPVDMPIELVKNADGTYSEVVRNVTYQWLFAAGKLNIGVLYILAVLSLAVYGVVIGGWASNNKYSFLGGLRATANMISYEIPLGLTIICIVLMYGSLDLNTMVDRQAGYWLGFIPAWNCFTQPLAFILFIVCIHAEANRAPFDTAEAEQELVGGYHTEYSAMRFALFFLAEYAGMVTTSAVCVAMFLGGWHLPWIDYIFPALSGNVAGAEPSVTTSIVAGVVRALVFFGKTGAIIFLFMWVRWSLPRFRFDQIMILAWRALIPISLALMMVTAVVVYMTAPRLAPGQAPATGVLPGSEAIALLIANVVVLIAAMIISIFLPQPAPTNRKMVVTGSRYRKTALPGTPVSTPAVAVGT